MQRGFFRVVLIFVLGLNLIAGLTSITTVEAKPLVVGVQENPPFVIYKGNQSFGYAVKVWKTVAKKLGWSYQFKQLSGKQAANIEQLKNHTIDVFIGNVSLNADNAHLIKFSALYYTDHVGLLVMKLHNSFGAILLRILKDIFSLHLIILVVLFILVLHTFWFLEERHKASQHYWSDISLFAWHLFTNTLGVGTQLTDQGNPRTKWGKIFAAIWLLISLIIVGMVVGSITSSITLYMGSNSAVPHLSDYKSRKIAVVISRENLQASKRVSQNIVPTETLGEAIELLQSKKVASIVDSVFELRKYVTAHKNMNIHITDIILSKKEYGVIFRRGSKRVVKYNQAFEEIAPSLIPTLCQQYFPKRPMHCVGV